MAADNSNPSYRHGHATKAGKSVMYRTWRSMMQRCYRHKEKSYPHYGGRGISVCNRWHDFCNFLGDMGERPEGMTLDRIDNSGNYCPENCRWVSRKVQQRNTRLTVMLTYNGVTKSVGDWADEYGISSGAIKQRIQSGWEVGDAITRGLLTAQEKAALGIAKRWAQ